MKSKKTPDLKQAGTETAVEEFARLAAELAQLNPARFRRFAARMMANREQVRAVRSRSHFPNKSS